MEDSQLISQDLVTTTFLSTPVTANMISVSEGQPKCLQMLAGSHQITDHGIPVGEGQPQSLHMLADCEIPVHETQNQCLQVLAGSHNSVIPVSEGQPQSLQVLAGSHHITDEVISVNEGRPQSLEVLTNSHHASTQVSMICDDDAISIEPGQSLLQTTGESLWLNKQIQYVVIQRDNEVRPTIAGPEITSTLTGEDQTLDELAGGDKLQCGLCGKIVNSVSQFLQHKSSHVARGSGLGCEVCGLSFSRQLALLDHYKRKHRIILVQKKPADKRCSKKTNKSHRKQIPSQDVVSITSHVKHKIGDTVIDQTTESTETHVEFSDYEKSNHIVTELVDMSVDVTDTLEENEAKVEEYGDTAADISDGKRLESIVDVSEHIADQVNVPVVGDSRYVMEGSREETVIEVSSLEVHNDDNGTSEEADGVLQNSDTDEVNANVIQIVGVPKINVDSVQADICDIEMTDLGNSNSSEKENVADKGEEEGYCLSSRQKLLHSASENVVKLSHHVKDLAKELNMPDFHFIPVIEKKGSKKFIHGGKYSFKCLYCELKVSWRSTLCKHMRENHADILKVGSLLTIPEKMNSGHEVMKMSDYINMETRPSGKRLRGIESQDLPGEFMCDKCDKIFYRLRYLRKHQNVHNKEKNLLCTVCVKTFKTLANLKQHMKSHRDREAYKCSECDFESTVNIAIHTHRQIHSQGCVLCEICGSAYSDKSTLTKHKQVHNPLRPFACLYPGCTWRFKTKAMCGAHYRAHTSRGKFECSLCGYAFRQKHHLQRHEKKVHNITPERSSFNYLEPASINFSKEQEITRLVSSSAEAVQEVSLVVNESNEVNVDTAEDQFDLESALQTGQLVIATEDGNTINYEMSDIGMNMSYQTLLQDSDGNQLDAHTILIPQSDGSHIIYQQEATETVNSEEKSKSLLDVSESQS